MYENEAIRCFSSWRKNGGWLKDIPIYAVCFTHNTISESTRTELEKLNVTYIEYYEKESDSYSSGFLQLPYIGKFFEKTYSINQNSLIRIDLDMTLIKPISTALVDATQYYDAVIGQYDVDSIKDQRKPYEDCLPFDTGFMLTDKRKCFNTFWYDTCFNSNVLNSAEWNDVKKQTGDYYLEEFAVDYINHNKLANILSVQKYQYGEGYASIRTFTDEQLKNLYFLHEHMYINGKFPWGYNSVKERMTYLNRMNRLKPQ